MARSRRILVPLDRLDGRVHTFGTYLSGWLRALAPRVEHLSLVRRAVRSYPPLDDLPQVVLPRFLEKERPNRLFFALWARRLGATVVHYPHLAAPDLWWGLAARRVVTIHDTASLTLDEGLVERMRGKTAWRLRRALVGFDAVVTVSESSRGELLRHFPLDPGRVHVIHHGVEKRFTPRGEESRADLAGRYGIAGPFILNVSSQKRKKNIAGLLRAFAVLVAAGYPHRLVLVGKQDNASGEIAALVRDLGLGERVVQTGFVAEEDHPEFYRRATLLAYPSFYEGFGMPVLEAMACGCPVVASNVSSLPEVAGDAALLVDPHSTGELVEAMRGVLDDSRLRSDLVARGLSRAGLFTWEKAADRHAGLYAHLLDGGSL